MKSLSPNLGVLDRNKVAESPRDSVKFENSHKDRDADGRRDRQPDQNHKEHLNDEEMELALATLRELEGVKANSLEVELVAKEASRIVLIKDLNGKVIRRIPEAELWPLIQDKERPTGHILDKVG